MSKYLLAIPFALTMGAFVQPESGLPDVTPPHEEAASEGVRVRIDLARGHRWVLDWDGLAVHDMATGALVRRVILPGAIFADARGIAPPDLVLSRSGAALVSSNTIPRLWRVSPERFEVEVYDLALASDGDRDLGFTSLAWGVGERALMASDSATGSPWRIDLASGSAQKVPAGLAVSSR